MAWAKSGRSFAGALLVGTGSCLGVLATEARAGAAGDVYNLDTFGGSTSIGRSVNEAGQVAGYGTDAGGVSRPFRYDGLPGAGGAMRDLSAAFPDDLNFDAFGVNDAGQVSVTGRRPGGEYHAFRYDGTPGAGGVARDLGVLAGGSRSWARGINASGQVVGYADGAFPGTHAFRYDGAPGAGGVMRDLGTLGGTFSYANAVNASGQVTGYTSTPTSGEYHAFRYDGTPGQGGVMRDLGTLGGNFSEGLGVNAAGQVVGDDRRADGTHRAFRYDGTPGQGGAMHDLGTVNGWDSYATAINDAGYVAGYADPYPSGGNRTALLWRPDGSVVDLDAWLNAANPAAGANWELYTAEDVSGTGWVTGWGNYHEPGGQAVNYRAYLLDASSLVTAPEPGGCALAAVGAVAACGRRRRVGPAGPGRG